MTKWLAKSGEESFAKGCVLPPCDLMLSHTMSRKEHVRKLMLVVNSKAYLHAYMHACGVRKSTRKLPKEVMMEGICERLCKDV